MNDRSTLEDLLVIGAVIAAGCEPCAERAVGRALSRGVPEDLIRHTVKVVAGLRSLDCFGQKVGPEVIARMERSLDAARRALTSGSRDPLGRL